MKKIRQLLLAQKKSANVESLIAKLGLKAEQLGFTPHQRKPSSSYCMRMSPSPDISPKAHAFPGESLKRAPSKKQDQHCNDSPACIRMLSSTALTGTIGGLPTSGEQGPFQSNEWLVGDSLSQTAHAGACNSQKITFPAQKRFCHH